MEKQLFSPDKTIGIPAYLPAQMIRSIRFLAFIACSKLKKFKQYKTEFYSFSLTPLTENCRSRF